jgi:hypothetical protein
MTKNMVSETFNVHSMLQQCIFALSLSMCVCVCVFYDLNDQIKSNFLSALTFYISNGTARLHNFIEGRSEKVNKALF